MEQPRKISSKVDNPIDNVFLDICEKVAPIFYETGHNANMITLYSAITGYKAYRALVEKDRSTFVIYFVISYFLDCLDGFYARKYSMQSKFGDYFDHTKDMVLSAALAYVYLTSYHISKYTFVILAILIFMGFKHTGCQQRVASVISAKNGGEKEHESIDILMNMCPDASDIRWTRFFGSGTMIIAFSAIIYLL